MSNSWKIILPNDVCRSKNANWKISPRTWSELWFVAKVQSCLVERLSFLDRRSDPANTVSLSPEQRQELHLNRQRELVKRLKSSIYHWQPLSFDEYRAKIYLATNFAAHYAMLIQIFNEVRREFRQRKIFEFSALQDQTAWERISTSSLVRLWLGRWFSDVVRERENVAFRLEMIFVFRAALHVWGKRTFAEILNVDKSRDMNQLSQLILQGGQPHKPPMIPGVVYRQFMPHGREVNQAKRFSRWAIRSV